jgi:CheY-like chemotaxis protein
VDGHEISCIYYPTTVVVVDDNKSVLENIELKIGKYVPCKTYSNPNEALNFLQKEMKRTDILKNVIELDESSDHYSHVSTQVPIQYDISKIYEHVEKRDRFSEISVIVVDYAMPGLNGDELCRKLQRTKTNPIKIIMLTGEADEPIAVKLFNAGIIDRFMMKSQPNVDEELKNTIFEMQNLYFHDVNYPIVRGIASDKDSSLGDQVFVDFFSKLLRDISASSYYLIETSGSFFLMDSAGNPTWLLIRTLHELEEIANQIEPEVSDELVDLIRRGEVVPYFGSHEPHYYADDKKLKKCLYKATRLKGERDYAYAILHEPPHGFAIKVDKIESLDDYIRSMP